MGLSYENRKNILKIFVTGGIKTFTLSQNIKKYCGFSGVRSTSLESCREKAPHSGYFRFLKVRVYSGSFDGSCVIKFIINGTVQGTGISVPSSTTEEEFISKERIKFNKGDLIACEVSTLSGSGNYRLSSYHEVRFNDD